MALKKENETQEAEKTSSREKMVRFRLFKDGGKYKDDRFVGVNGKGYIVQRGVDVEMPESVYNVLVLSEEQIENARQVMDDCAMTEYDG